MSLRLRLILLIVVITCLGFWRLTSWVLDEVRPRTAEAMEDALADATAILASFVEDNLKEYTIDTESLKRIFTTTLSRHINAQIYALTKDRVDARFYVTDEQGVVIFDSSGLDTGANYSQWRNVAHALRGEYGTRTSHEERFSPQASVMHITLPLRRDNRILGTLTIAKPTTNLTLFLEAEKSRIMIFSGEAAATMLIVGILLTIWMTAPLERLGAYARAVRDGRRAPLPKLGNNEIGILGHDFEQMRVALEGKNYVENYIHNLTHEIKSPLTAIQAAAELLREDMPILDRQKFLENIRIETGRLKDLADRLLGLAALENRRGLENKESIAMDALVKSIVTSLEPRLKQKKIQCHLELDAICLGGSERFLIEQALTNIFNNAIDFSPVGGTITARWGSDKDELGVLQFILEDQGPGIPEYALPHIFEKFYSLPRPDTGRKSTGLGLAFVMEVMEMHAGTVVVENLLPHGTRVVLTWE